MMELPEADCLAIACQALAEYALEPAEVVFLGQGENLTFQVSQAGGKRYLLRLHLPSGGAFSPQRCRPQAIRSELAWLDALGQERDLTIPQPVRGWNGELVGSVHNPFAGSQENGRSILPVSLLGWVEGEPVGLEGGSTQAAPPATMVQTAQRLGVLLRRLQDHGRRWRAPEWFLRPSYGAEFFAGVAAALAPGLVQGVVRATDLAVIRATVALAWELVAAGQGRQESWGLIHNDLHPGNVILQGEKLCPIDFSLCGFGPYWLDLGASLGSLPHGLRRAFLDGYTAGAGLPETTQQAVEGCLLVSRLSYYAFMLPDQDQWLWLTSRIPVVVETMCLPFLDGEPFLFTIR